MPCQFNRTFITDDCQLRSISPPCDGAVVRWIRTHFRKRHLPLPITHYPHKHYPRPATRDPRASCSQPSPRAMPRASLDRRGARASNHSLPRSALYSTHILHPSSDCPLHAEAVAGADGRTAAVALRRRAFPEGPKTSGRVGLWQGRFRAGPYRCGTNHIWAPSVSM